MFIRNRVSWSLAMLALMSTGGLLQGCKSDGNGGGKGDAGVAGINVFPPSGLQTTEQAGANQTATFAVVLSTPPTADVTIGISSSDTGEGTVSVATLTFTANNWASPQTVTVTGVDDDESDGDVTYTIVTAPAQSEDLNYAGINPADVTIKNVDNDSAGIRALETTGLTTTEAGGMAKFKVVLNTRPNADVTVPISSSDTGEVTATPTLTFTPSNWNSPQEVTVKGVDDDAADGNIEVTISSPGATSTDTRYAGKKFDDVKVSNVDNDSAGFIIDPLVGLQTTEAGGTDTFTVKLTTKPTADVVLPLSSANPLEASIDKPSLTFTADNWSSPQTVTVTGVDDNLQDDDQVFVIATAPAMSADTRYDGRNPDDVGGLNSDNDTPGFTLTDTDDLVVKEDGTTDVFYVRLRTRPATTVTVAVSTNPATEASASPATLEFTIDNWSAPHPVTVTGLPDDELDGDAEFVVLLAAAAGDEAYAGIDPPDVTGTNEDDDSPAVRVTPTTLEVSEAGSTATFTVGLETKPSATVEISVVSGNTDEVQVLTSSPLRFTVDDWAPKTVTVKGVDDSVIDNNSSTTITVGQPVTDDEDYAMLSAQTVTVTNVDNDQAGVALLFDNQRRVTTEDGGQFRFWVYLRSAPTATVTFPIEVSNGDEAVVVTSQVEFSPTDWSGPKVVIIEGKDDMPPVQDIDQPYQVVVGGAAGSTSTDASYNGRKLFVDLVNEDNDTPGVRIEPDLVGNNTTLVTSETGTTARFRISLRSRPDQDVTVTLSNTGDGADEVSLSDSSITIQPNNWNANRYVTITGLNDNPPVADGNIPFLITTSVTSSTDPAYNNLPVDDVAVVNNDDDSPGYVITQEEDPLLTSEDALTSKWIRVRLATQPEIGPGEKVIVPVTVSPSDEATTDAVMPLEFTLADWNVVQEIHVTGSPDATQDGRQDYEVRFGPTTGDDPKYNALTYTAVDAQNLDIDTPEIVASPINGLQTKEGGDQTVFSLRLTKAPTGNVSIPITSLDLTEGTIITTSPVVFTPTNYASPRQIVVAGVDDLLDDRNQNWNVRVGPATSTDPAYAGRSIPNIRVENVDDDTAGIDITLLGGGPFVGGEPDRLQVSETGSTTATFRVKLTSQPTAPVAVTFNTGLDATEATISGTYTFYPASLYPGVPGPNDYLWNDANVVVTLTAVNDVIIDGPIDYNITVTSTSTDPDYQVGGAGAVATAKTVKARTVDTDSPGLIVTPQTAPPLVVLEEGTVAPAVGPTAQRTIHIALNSMPSATVNVPIYSTDITEGTLTGPAGSTAITGLTPNTAGISVPIAPADWSTGVTVTLTAVQDDVDDGARGYSIAIGNTTSTDTNYAGLNYAAIGASTTDADVAGFSFGTFSPPGPTIAPSEAGATATIRVVMNSKPLGTVTLGVSAGGANPGQVTLDTNVLTFTTDNWNDPTAHQVVVSAVNDSIDDTDLPFLIEFGTVTIVDPADMPYDDLNLAPPVLADVVGLAIDNDTAGISVVHATPFGAGSGTLALFEDGGGTAETLTFTLNSMPTSTVSILVELTNTGGAVITAANLEHGANPAASAQTITWTPAQFTESRVITVRGVSDTVPNAPGAGAGSRNIYVRINNATSLDGNYGGHGPTPAFYTGAVSDTPRTCLSARTLWSGAVPGSGVIWLDTDLAGTINGNVAPQIAYCDQATDGGGWTLLAYAGDTLTEGGMPYPGQAGATRCVDSVPTNCANSTGIGLDANRLPGLFAVSTEFGQGQKTLGGVLRDPYANLGTYDFAGRYNYGSLATLALEYTTGTCSQLLTGSYTNIVGTANVSPVTLAQALRSPLPGNNYSNYSQTFTYSVGSPGPACTISGNAPVSYLGTWQTPQYGPQSLGADGSYVLYVR